METKKGRCRNRGSKHNAELPKGLFYHWDPTHPLANSDFAVGLLRLHICVCVCVCVCKTPQILLMVQKYLISTMLVKKNTQPVAHPLKLEQLSEKLIKILSFP